MTSNLIMIKLLSKKEKTTNDINDLIMDSLSLILYIPLPKS